MKSFLQWLEDVGEVFPRSNAGDSAYAAAGIRSGIEYTGPLPQNGGSRHKDPKRLFGVKGMKKGKKYGTNVQN